MGKAAIQRKKKRIKYLSGLSKKDPEQFEKEWKKRLSSWIQLIRRDAGKLNDNNGRQIPPVFDRVEEAMAILKACGEGVFKHYQKWVGRLASLACHLQLVRPLRVHAGTLP